MKLRLAALSAMVAFGAASAAHAQTSEKFRSLDRDGDGTLSSEEVSAIRGYERAFGEADDNRDGRLDPDEFIKAESIHQRSLAGAYVGDSAVTAKVKTALLRERGLKATDVHVETYRGRVLLSGWVDSDEQKERAVRVASRVGGVLEVKDGLIVR